MLIVKFPFSVLLVARRVRIPARSYRVGIPPLAIAALNADFAAAEIADR
jgi:hypothetical protein